MIYLIISKLKKNLISILCIIFIIFLVVYSKSSIDAVKSGLELWINSVVPSLFPFFIATEILCSTNIINVLGRILEKAVSKLFNVPGEGAFALIMGTICGYPSGAKIVVNLKEDKILNTEEAERLIAFTNNSGPLFIIGTVGVALLNNAHIGYLLLISHLISCVIVGIIFRNWKKSNSSLSNKKVIREEKNVGLKDLGEILGNSIRNSIVTIVNIGGFVVFFSVIISMLNSVFGTEKNVQNSIIYGIIELTNGVQMLSSLGFSTINICIMSFILGFGGLSVLFQVYSIISKENISIKPYFYGKLLQGVISFFITLLLVNIKI